MLGPDGVNRLLNDSQNHHLVDAHIPLLLPALEGAFGGRYARARVPRSVPPPDPSSSGRSIG